jgi:hypothetical protein
MTDDGDFITCDAYFGGCPVCGKTNGYLNVSRDHWFYCDEHQTRWCAGSNLFSGWRHESRYIWVKNKARLADYTPVEPLGEGVWPRDPAARAEALARAEERVLAEHEAERAALVHSESDSSPFDDSDPFGLPSPPSEPPPAPPEEPPEETHDEMTRRWKREERRRAQFLASPEIAASDLSWQIDDLMDWLGMVDPSDWLASLGKAVAHPELSEIAARIGSERLDDMIKALARLRDLAAAKEAAAGLTIRVAAPDDIGLKPEGSDFDDFTPF